GGDRCMAVDGERPGHPREESPASKPLEPVAENHRRRGRRALQRPQVAMNPWPATGGADLPTGANDTPGLFRRDAHGVSSMTPVRRPSLEKGLPGWSAPVPPASAPSQV